MFTAADLSAYAYDCQELSVNSSASFSLDENENKYFSVTLPSTGKITFSLSSSQFSNSGNGNAYVLCIVPGKNSADDKYIYNDKSFEYNDALGYFSNAEVSFSLMKGTYIFKFSSDASGSVPINYFLSCNFTPSDESFPESLSGKREQFLSDANYINTDTIYYGQISNADQEGFDDVDIFAFNLKKGKLFFDFAYFDYVVNSYKRQTYIGSFGYIYNSEGEPLDNYDYDQNCYIIDTAGTYYLKVTGQYIYGKKDFYSFKISQSDYSKVNSKVTGLKASQKNPTSIKLKWTKKSGASGYEVQKYNGKKWTAYKTIKSNTNSVTVSKLKALTQYKFRVRAYTIVNGKKTTGAYSSAFSVSTTSKKITGVKLKMSINDKKQTAYETVIWKTMKGVSGYQIQFGTDGSNYDKKGIYWCDKISVKGASRKNFRIKVPYASDQITDAVRIRPYKTVKGKKIYGAWSKTVHLS